MDIAELRRQLEEAREAMRQLDTEIGESEMTDEQTTRWQELEDKATALRTQIEAAERRSRVQESRSRWRSITVDGNREDRFATIRSALPQIRRGEMSGPNMVGTILRGIEGRVEIGQDDERHIERMLRRHLCRDEDSGAEYGWDFGQTRRWAHQLMVRCLPEYVRGFNKIMRGGVHAMLALSEEERVAIAVGTNTSGGFLVPTHLDPTVILTSSGSANVVRQIARVVTLDPGQGNVWHGISSTGMTASWDAEYTEVSDDTPSFLQPAVSLHTARTFAKATFQAVEDIPDLATELLTLFADARDVAEGGMHCTGSGSGQPYGIVTALDANTNVEVISTTAATIGTVDINGLLRSVPQRFRRRSQWLMNDVYADAIMALGTAVGASYTGTLAEALSETLKGKPWHTSDDMPSTQTTTVNDNEIVVGAWDQFVIVDRPGSMAVEFIQNLVGTTNALPTGERGWICWWRNGSDSVNDLAFRLLQDKTSA